MANFESNIKYTSNVGNYQKDYYYKDLEFESYQSFPDLIIHYAEKIYQLLI